MAQKKETATVEPRRTGGKHLAAAPASRRPARPGQQRKTTSKERQVNAAALYAHFTPYIEEAHKRNERSLKAGVWLLVLLPIVLVAIRELTDASKIVFLIIWIFGMFGIATALIFTAYSDHDLKKTLEELKEIVPPEEELEIGNLLPVDAEGEGWLINPEELPIPLPDLAEKIPQMSEELKGRIAERGAARQEELAQRREVRQQRVEAWQQRREERRSPSSREKGDEAGKTGAHEARITVQPEERTETALETYAAPKHLADENRRQDAAEAGKTSRKMLLDDELLKGIGKKRQKREK